MKSNIGYTAALLLGCIGIFPFAEQVSASPAVVLNCSFEPSEQQQWTLLRQYADIVASNTSFFNTSNLDGVKGSQFLLFGMGSNPGKIRFELTTVPGRTYSLSYQCGATDTGPPISSGKQSVWFASTVQGYHGRKTITDHWGDPVEVDDLDELGSQLHKFSVPGLVNWKIHSWEKGEYSFKATSALTRIEFDTTFTTAMASVGALDQVVVTTEPFASISNSGTDLKVDYAGTLQQSSNFHDWADVIPQPASPFSIVPSEGARFFRVKK